MAVDDSVIFFVDVFVDVVFIEDVSCCCLFSLFMMEEDTEEAVAVVEVGFPICWYLTLGSSQLVDLV